MSHLDRVQQALIAEKLSEGIVGSKYLGKIFD